MSRHVSMFRGKSALFVLAATLLLLPVFARAALNRYALILADPPAGARFISRESLAAVDARNYRAQLELKQRSLIAELRMRNITAVGAVSTVLNAVFVTAPAERVDEMKALPGVAGVVRMRRGRPLLNTATQLLNAPAAWALPAIGGQLNAGKGIKIGILDSGIDQNHPAFQDSTLTLPKGNYPICTPGYPDDCGYTNSKVIVARSYVRQIAGFQYHGDNITGPPDPATSQPDDYSPRDRFGHGTAVASCAAANPTSTGAVPISGMAPKAYLGNYKIAGSPGVNDSPPEDVWIQAINDALNDGMDVVNMSWGTTPISGALDTGAACGQAAGVPCDLLATAFENAAQHGLVIVAAAGNSGSLGDAYSYYPVYNSISSPANAPSVLAVGATLNSHTFWPTVSVAGPGAPSTLQNLKAFPSDSFLFAYYGSLIAPLLDASTKGDGYACSAFPPGSFAGVYALVQRGPTGANACDFNTKATNVQNAGATGMILYNSADSPALPNNNTTIEGVASFVGPLVGLTNTDGVALKSYLAANPGALVSIDLSGVAHAPDGVANQLASYSSFGPGLGAFPACATCSKLLLKPDLLATGGGDPNIYPDPSGNGVDLYGFPGIYMATQSFDTMGVLYGANGYAASNGTSFASPLVAGAAALVKQAHPGWTAAQIRSALVNWANASAVTSDDMGQITQLDVRNVGGGLLDAAAAVNATVVANPATVSFGGLKTGGAMPAAQPITVTNVSSSPVSLTVAVSPLAGQSGLSANIALDKQTLNLGAAGSSSDTAVLTVSMTGSIPAATGAYSGNILLASSGAVMRIPYLFLVGSNTASSGGNIVPISVTSVDGFISQDLGALAVQVLDTAGVPVVGAPVTFSRSSGSVTLTLRSAGGGEPACSPDSSTTAVTCNTDNYGIAYVDLVGGSTPGTSTVTIQVPGYTAVQYPSFSVNLRLIPDTRNVTESAQYVSTIAPGSYVSLFGLNLSDLQDSAATTTLPLSLDGVTVSFDAGNVSAPGSITFVSPSQVNVQAPWELQGLPAGTQVKMKVTINETEYGTVFSAPLADISPAFFNDNNAGLVAARDATYNQITASHPAVRGEAVLLYLNGLGPVDHPLASGAPASSTTLARTTSQPTVTIGGQNAEVLFSGLAPGYPGLYQVNVKVPQNIATGNQPIGISIGGKSSPATVTLNGKAVAMVLPVQ